MTALDPPFVELLFLPNPALITVTRCFIVDFYSKAIGNVDAAHRLALVTHELLENAAKYSSDGEAALTIGLDASLHTVSVGTRNRATPARIAEVQDTFRAISAARDAGTFYAQAMRRTAVRLSGSGGLGLARIWAEADMELRLRVKGDQVEIHACGKMVAG